MNEPYRVVTVALFTQPLRARLPFRYGITTMTEMPHVFLQVELAAGSRVSRGLAADHLPPKWFTKDPDAPIAAEIETMRLVITHAGSLVSGISFTSVFELWRDLWIAQSRWARSQGHPPLLAHFGTSLVERAVIDAFCRIEGLNFAECIRSNRLGIKFSEIDPSIPQNWLELLPAAPLSSVVARHTVGLVDTIFESDLRANGARFDDGLPQSLERAVRDYGLREFKVKIGGNGDQDEARVSEVISCLEKHAGAHWRFSIDGNENFMEAESFRAYWERLSAVPALRRNLDRLMFIEQPLRRSVALGMNADWRNWPSAPPITIDESDGDLDDVPKSLALGYAGSTHKNCKGVIKGILNRCRLIMAAAQPGRKMMMSGEDLTNIGPVALPQDLVMQSVLGNRSVERNGHYYFRGLSMWPEHVQHAMLEAHPDLYEKKADLCTVRINEGQIQLDSLLLAPFGYAVSLDPRGYCSTAEEIR